MRIASLLLLISVLFFTACRDSRIADETEWKQYFAQHGIDSACIMLRDNNHESVHYYNKERCLERFTPASTFKIFNSLVALETAIAPDERLVINWDSVTRWNADWNEDMDMRKAFKVSNVGYYQELARRVGKEYMQYYLDTVRYGNQKIGNSVDSFWLDNSLQISADEQLGFVKRLYFAELPFSERTQRIVKSMMLAEDNKDYKLYYKTGWGSDGKKDILWLVGFAERIEQVQEPEGSMNKSSIRTYPYFFAMNFDKPTGENKDWAELRKTIVKNILIDFGAIPGNNKQP